LQKGDLTSVRLFIILNASYVEIFNIGTLLIMNSTIYVMH